MTCSKGPPARIEPESAAFMACTLTTQPPARQLTIIIVMQHTIFLLYENLLCNTSVFVCLYLYTFKCKYLATSLCTFNYCCHYCACACEPGFSQTRQCSPVWCGCYIQCRSRAAVPCLTLCSALPSTCWQ